MNKILNNKFLRLVTSIVLAIVICLLFTTLPKAIMGDKYNAVDDALSITFMFLIISTILLHLLGDVLNCDKLNKGFFALLKRILFDAVAIINVVIAIALTWSDSGTDLNLFEKGLARLTSFACPLLCAAWLVASSKGFDAKTDPFYMPTAVVAAYVLGILFALIGSKDVANGIITFADIALLAGMIVWRVKIGGAFSDFDIDSTACIAYTPKKSASKSSANTATSGNDNFYKFKRDLDCAMQRFTYRKGKQILQDGSEMITFVTLKLYNKHADYTVNVESGFPDDSNVKTLEDAQKKCVAYGVEIQQAAEKELEKLKKTYGQNDFEYTVNVSVDKKYTQELPVDGIVAEAERLCAKTAAQDLQGLTDEEIAELEENDISFRR